MITSVGRVYAEALFSIAKERSEVEEIGAELEDLVRLLDGNPSFALFLSTPVLEAPVKIVHLKKAFEGNMSPVVADFVCLLVEKRRAGALLSVSEAYRGMADAFANRARVRVRSARPLNDSLRAEIEELLRTGLAKDVALEAETAPSLMGGAVITVGDTVYDGSVKRRLAQFRKQIMRSGGYEAQG